VTAWDAAVDAHLLQTAGPESLKPLEAWSKVVTLEPGAKQSIHLTPVSFEKRQQAFAVR